MKNRPTKVKVVIDHLARIDLEKKDSEPEIKKLLALAKHPNVYVKVSELMILSVVAARAGVDPEGDPLLHAGGSREDPGPQRREGVGLR